ncbi:MAG: ComF family protein [Porticoccaceae bacterium]
MIPAGTQDQIRYQIQNLGFLLFPGICLLCQRRSKRKLDLCHACEAALPRLETGCLRCALPLLHPGVCGYCQGKPPSFTSVFTPYLYQFPTDRMIHSFKYGGKFKYGRVLATLLAELLNNTERLNNSAPPPDVLLPVPLHWRRQIKRGFNQAELIARALSRQLDIPINTRLISRTRYTDAQEGLSRRERQGNLRQAFTATPDVKGLSIAVIDDVVTTGSTAEAVAHCLVRAGAQQVQVWALARTPLEK